MPDIGNKVRMLGASLAKKHLRMAGELYAGASSRCVINGPMALELERTTGVKADLVERCAVEPEALDKLRASPPAAPAPGAIRIGYAGTIIAEDAFILFVEALQKIRGELPAPVEIHIFGSQRYGDRRWFDPSLIIEHGFVPDAELDRLYGECNWGLAMMQMHDDDPRYNRFSFPCKFTMALASGLPLICLGHPQSGLMELALRYRLGIMITEPDAGKAASVLLKELPRSDRLGEYHSEIARCAENDFNAEMNRRRLYELFHADLRSAAAN
jgi:glycosyltransferase involved in cell wall biosynthesis